MKRASLQDIRRMKDRGELGPSAEPEAARQLDEDFWDEAVVSKRSPRRSVHLKLDPDVFDYFKGLGQGHLTRMQDVLRAYVRHQQGRHR